MRTPQELTDECGEVVWLGYEWAWGGRYTHHYTSQSLNDCAIIESDLQPIRFQGQFYDVETGLHYNRFRYYDSDVGDVYPTRPDWAFGWSKSVLVCAKLCPIDKYLGLINSRQVHKNT